jgi:hypothetical protein
VLAALAVLHVDPHRGCKRAVLSPGLLQAVVFRQARRRGAVGGAEQRDSRSAAKAVAGRRRIPSDPATSGRSLWTPHRRRVGNCWSAPDAGGPPDPRGAPSTGGPHGAMSGSTRTLGATTDRARARRCAGPRGPGRCAASRRPQPGPRAHRDRRLRRMLPTAPWAQGRPGSA